LLIRPEKACHQVITFTDVLDATGEGGVVAVRSMSIDTSLSKKEKFEVPLALRSFKNGSGTRYISIWEETGESIARHIWYG
jgi:hypothetical protein